MGRYDECRLTAAQGVIKCCGKAVSPRILAAAESAAGAQKTKGKPETENKKRGIS